MKRAFIEQRYPNNDNRLSYYQEWWSGNCSVVARELEHRGWFVKGFHKSELDKLRLSKNTLVKGSIRTTRRALELIGVPQPENVDIPKGLMRYAHRKIWETTLGEIRRAGKRVFIKPLNYQKAFCGHVAEYEKRWDGFEYVSTSEFDRETLCFPDNFPVLASTVTEMHGEWRAYILEGKVKEIRDYHGGYPYERPTIPQVQKLVDACKNQRAAWSLDVTYILNKNKKPMLSVVEANEAFSCGYFGQNWKLYTDMTIARWNEMTGAKL